VAAAAGESALPSRSKGSQLCLTCGICCQGVFFSHDEDPVRYGLDPDSIAARHANPLLPLTCRLYRDDRCLVHEEPTRPPCCRESRCQLLRRLLAEEISLEQAGTISRNIKTRLAGVVVRMPPGERSKPALLLMAAELDVLRTELAAGDRSRIELFVGVVSLLRLLHQYVLPFEGVA